MLEAGFVVVGHNFIYKYGAKGVGTVHWPKPLFFSFKCQVPQFVIAGKWFGLAVSFGALSLGPSFTWRRKHNYSPSLCVFAVKLRGYIMSYVLRLVHLRNKLAS